jgi:hypothetical protein
MHCPLFDAKEMRPVLLNDSDAISVRGCHQYAVIVGNTAISFVSVMSPSYHWELLRFVGGLRFSGYSSDVVIVSDS